MIYDCFIFYNELDLLEIRLEELKDVVDFFVLVEATKTFTNRPKKLYYNENKHLFGKFVDRIIHIVVDDLPVAPKDTWEIQFHQRNAISRGLTNCQPEDIVIISDVDEIPRASVVGGFTGDIALLEQNFYYYKFNCLSASEKWAIPAILRYRLMITPQIIRRLWYDQVNRKIIPIIPNAGWHFSYLGDAEHIRTKLESFSQQDFVTDELRNLNNISEKMEDGIDLFNRPGKIWQYVEIDESYPAYILNNRAKYSKYIKELSPRENSVSLEVNESDNECMVSNKCPVECSEKEITKRDNDLKDKWRLTDALEKNQVLEGAIRCKLTASLRKLYEVMFGWMR